MTGARPRRAFRLGHNDCLVATISDPATRKSDVGVIMWGISVADMGTARALAKLGFVAMQIHEPGKNTYSSRDEHGVLRCQEAMDALTAKRGVRKFVLMGNCASASICFNAALIEPRIAGVVMTNPHVSEVLSLGSSYKKKLLRAETWWRFFTGRLALRRHVENTRSLKKALVGRLAGADEKALVAMSAYSKALTLPDHIDEKFKMLGERGVSTLVIFSRDDVSLDYFTTAYGKSFDRLKSLPGLSLEVISQTAHEIYRDDAAVDVVTDLVCRWAAGASFAASTTTWEPVLVGPAGKA